MSQSAYIKFVKGSEVSSMTLDEVKEQLEIYKDQTSKTGEQLGWEYSESAFPYSIVQKPEGENKWFYLKGDDDRYRYIVVGIGSEELAGAESSEESEESEEPAEQVCHYIQMVLPDDSTYGDKNKANELCKFIGRRLKAELHMFNGRVMYFNPRK